MRYTSRNTGEKTNMRCVVVCVCVRGMGVVVGV